VLVYGDDERVVEAGEVVCDLIARLQTLKDHSTGISRHAALVAAFIEAGELMQAVADAEFAICERDEISPAQDTGARLLALLAEMLIRSRDSGFAAAPMLPRECLSLLNQFARTGPVRLRSPEGYAFYALYPEAYIEAARRSGLGSDTVVIGIRSIGTGLAALVAAALGARPAITLRPIGHPYQRRVAIGEQLEARLVEDKTAAFAIVDEGPGLSGSSFGATLDWLEAHGIARERCHVFPSHTGDPGPQASAGHRASWAQVQRHVVTFEDLLLRPSKPQQRLESWVETVTGPLTGPLEEISGGAWRAKHYANKRDWPPADPMRERRKFLARTRNGAWLVKFAGLGAQGERKLALNCQIAAAGYTPQAAGLVHGFLIEPWIEGHPLDIADFDRGRVLARLAGYLGLRARLPASGSGASLRDLFVMAVQNTREALGEEAALQLEGALGDPARLQPTLRPVVSDNRLHLWEWLVTPNGRLIKTDALDHCSAHDLVGCQDIAWDVAGAGVEFDLSEHERARLVEALARTAGRHVDAELLRVLEPCYLAFQIGLWTFAGAAATDADESGRVARQLQRYRERLQQLI